MNVRLLNVATGDDGCPLLQHPSEPHIELFVRSFGKDANIVLTNDNNMLRIVGEKFRRTCLITGNNKNTYYFSQVDLSRGRGRGLRISSLNIVAQSLYIFDKIVSNDSFISLLPYTRIINVGIDRMENLDDTVPLGVFGLENPLTELVMQKLS